MSVSAQLTQICQYLRNWFEREKLFGDFAISGGALTYADGSALPLVDGQYFRVMGSLFNDGAHKYGDAEDVLTDETFSGAVWLMAVPPLIVQTAADIAAWESANAKAINNPYQSESFGGYSYSLRGGDSDGGGLSWTKQAQFLSRLAPWRKI